MYRYARTRNRVHRVVIEGGRAFKVENCNLDDVGFLNLVDVIPEGTRCSWCWAGYTEPTPEQKAAESAENAKREETVKEEIPPNAKAIPLVTSTRRMAALVLAAALLFGTAVGVLASPDVTPPKDVDLSELRTRIDDLFVQVRVLSVDINGHTHEAAAVQSQAPIIIVVPTVPPSFTPIAPVGPSAEPSEVPTPTAVPDGAVIPRTVVEERRTTIIVVPPAPIVVPQTAPQPTAAPTTQPTPRPIPTEDCFRPGISKGVRDRCRWPQN